MTDACTHNWKDLPYGRQKTDVRPKKSCQSPRRMGVKRLSPPHKQQAKICRMELPGLTLHGRKLMHEHTHHKKRCPGPHHLTVTGPTSRAHQKMRRASRSPHDHHIKTIHTSLAKSLCVCYFVLLNQYWGIVTVPGSFLESGDLGWPDPHPAH